MQKLLLATSNVLLVIDSMQILVSPLEHYCSQQLQWDDAPYLYLHNNSKLDHPFSAQQLHIWNTNDAGCELWEICNTAPKHHLRLWSTTQDKTLERLLQDHIPTPERHHQKVNLGFLPFGHYRSVDWAGETNLSLSRHLNPNNGEGLADRWS